MADSAAPSARTPTADEAMSGRIAIFGYGPVGRAIAGRLSSEDRELIIAQRRAPPDLPKGAAFAPCDALDRDAVAKAARGADQIVVSIGFEYSGVVWREAWPRAMTNFVAACKATGARMTFIDNLYMYGPQTAPLVETMPLADFGWKPAARSAATRIWMAAAAAGEARIAALRAPDFYGPGVGNSYLGDMSIGKLAQGKPAVFIGSPDVLHDYAYVPDIARAATSLLDAPDSAFGQAWHVPCAPTRTTRDLLRIAADALGVKLRISAMPAWMLGASGMFSPFLRELVEMRFQWDRPYRVDASRFAKAFWSDPTPFETGIRETALAYSAIAKKGR
jgi:nucleoside-diphosphate-sugar epimerase